MPTDLNTIRLLLPELILVMLAAWLFIGSAFKPSRPLWTGIGIVTFFLVAIALFRQDAALWSDGGLLQIRTGRAFSGPLLIDLFGHMGRWIAVVIGPLFLLMAARASDSTHCGEYLGAAVLAFVGIMLVAAAGDVVLLFLGLELISIPSYIVLFLGRNNRLSSEATVKYFFLSILASAMFLYGLSFLYGVAGSTDLDVIRSQLAGVGSSPLAGFLPISLVLMFAGLGFKIAAVPFHFYAPDVYQATTNANAGLLAVVPKVAGIFALVRLSVAVSPAASELAWQLMLAMSVLSMTLGNVCALWQQNLRRLMAYSSIAHAGYMLIGIAVAMAAADAQTGYDGIAATLFYLLVYAAASLGTFAVLAYLSSEEEASRLDELSGLSRQHPIAAALLAVFMFSLSGIPPFAGFWGKLALFTGALGQANEGDSSSIWFLVLAISAAINAAIAAGYYLRVVAAVYFGTTADSPRSVPRRATTAAPGLAAAACGAFVVVAGIVPGWLIGSAREAGKSARDNGPPAVVATAEVPPTMLDAPRLAGSTAQTER